MGIRDLIKKKDQLDGGRDGVDRETLDRLAGPEFTFVRSDTQTHEIIRPPSYPTEYGQSNNYSNNNDNNYLAAKDAGSSASKTRRSLDVFRPRSRGSSTSSVQSDGSSRKDKEGGHHGHRRLSQRLHLSKAPSTSDYVPENLPQINLLAAEDGGSGVAAGKGGVDKDLYENQWEKRATILAEANVRGQRRIASPSSPSADIPSLALHDYDGGNGNGGGAPHGRIDGGGVSSKAVDDMIQEAIRLHESGQLDQSTQLFGRLADPHGANNPLSQVLYGLALRHGWGCQPDTERAVTYLSAAASNAAAVESMALQAGLKKGGAAKGELVLAIFELANCFRHGWGIPRDPVAAKQYYETAANLGDTDAMNEVGWCYLEGFGCKKDKYAAARYYRLAEQNGNKTIGNTWIWKDKYNPTNPKKK